MPVTESPRQPATPPAAATEANRSLDPADWPAFRAQAHRMLDDMLTYLEDIRERPVWQMIPDEVRSRFRTPLPSEPSELADVHREFMTSILPFTAANTHPGFFGWVQGGGSPVGMLAEMLAAGLNANTGGRDQTPLELERQVTGWMRDLFGFPADATGIFLTGTSMANFVAAVIARDARLSREGNKQTAKLTAYASTAAHGSVAKALELAGLGRDCLRPIPVDGNGCIDLAILASTIVEDRAAGLIPFFAAGNAGTVDIGAIDDLTGLAQLCEREELWFHVDGALGALAMLSPQLAPRLRGIELADSLAFDFHKWAQVPYDAGFLLVRDGQLHRQAFASSCTYLGRAERGLSAGSPWPCDLGPELSRNFRALKVWTALKVYGTAAIGAVIANTCELAQYLRSRIEATPELQLMAPVALNVVCFRYRFEFAATSQLDRTREEFADQSNRELVIRLQESGIAVPSQTVLGGRIVIRAAIVNHRTSRAEIDALVAASVLIGRELVQELKQA